MDGDDMSRGAARWALILAGGRGVRLRPLTRRIADDDRPKQFCAILDGETLWAHTRGRAGLVVPAERTLSVVTAAHERFYAPLFAGLPAAQLVVQPTDRGTAPAILHGLLRVAVARPTGAVVVLPSDHYVSDEAGFMLHVDAAFRAVDRRPDLLVLLGMRPESAEVEYGWIEPGRALALPDGWTLHRVSRFWEKPAPALAQGLFARGCLWNTFVMVGRVPAFLSLIRSAAPELFEGFERIRASLGTASEPAAVRRLHARLPPINFSQEVLAACPANLAVLPVNGVAWSDLGTPGRVLGVIVRTGVRPAWLGTATRDADQGTASWHDAVLQILRRRDAQGEIPQNVLSVPGESRKER
jgi:mannose-1-phosphate guanylyltransferase